MKMMKRLFLLTVVFSIAVGSALFATCVLAQPIAIGMQGQPTTTATVAQSSVTAAIPPTATVSLDPISSCSSGTLQISITTPIDWTRQYGIATTSTGTVLFEFEYDAPPGTSYTGSYGFGSFSVPAGTIVTLYGYVGQTPPKAATTAEFSVSYRCDADNTLQRCAGPYGPCAKAPDFPVLDGRWFKLNAVVNGYDVADANGVIKPHNFTVPLYMGFSYNTTNFWYDVRVFTQTAPGVWTQTFTTTKNPLVHTQNFLSDFNLQIYVKNAADYVYIYHTPYIKYGLDRTGVLKTATYSGTGEVFTGSFNAGATRYYGSVRISGSMVSVTNLPFTP